MAPLLKELMLWAGNREVSRKGFQNALDQERAVVICPGGQASHRPRHCKSDRVVTTRFASFSCTVGLEVPNFQNWRSCFIVDMVVFNAVCGNEA